MLSLTWKSQCPLWCPFVIVLKHLWSHFICLVSPHPRKAGVLTEKHSFQEFSVSLGHGSHWFKLFSTFYWAQINSKHTTDIHFQALAHYVTRPFSQEALGIKSSRNKPQPGDLSLTLKSTRCWKLWEDTNIFASRLNLALVSLSLCTSVDPPTLAALAQPWQLI